MTLKAVASGLGGGAPSGAAGGSLAGTYPNPSLAAINSIGTSLAIGGATIGTDALGVTGTTTLGGRVVDSGNGAASFSAMLLNGTIFTGGTGTTNFPQFLIQPTGTTASSTWATTGTAIGVNVSGTPNLIDLQLAGASKFTVSSAGLLTTGGSIVSGSNVQVPGGNQYQWTSRGILSSPAAGSIQLGGLDAAAPVAQTLRIQSVVAGTAATNGVNWTMIGSLPTGTGTSGDIIFQTGVKTGSGTTQGTPTTALTIKGESQTIVIASGKQLQLGNAAVTGLTPGALAALTNATLTLTDSTGTVYRIPAITP